MVRLHWERSAGEEEDEVAAAVVVEDFVQKEGGGGWGERRQGAGHVVRPAAGCLWQDIDT